MLTLGEIQDRVRSQLRDQSQQVFSDSDITRYGNDALRNIAAETNAFWTTATISGGTVAGTATYNLPTDFVRMVKVFYNDNSILPETTINTLAELTANMTTQGTPYCYYIQRTPPGGTSQVPALLGLYYIPSAASVTIRFYYNYVPATLSASTSRFPVPYGYDDPIVSFICWQLKKADREPGEADRYRSEWNQWLDKMKKQLVPSINSHRVMGRDVDSGFSSRAPRFDPATFGAT